MPLRPHRYVGQHRRQHTIPRRSLATSPFPVALSATLAVVTVGGVSVPRAVGDDSGVEMAIEGGQRTLLLGAPAAAAPPAPDERRLLDRRAEVRSAAERGAAVVRPAEAKRAARAAAERARPAWVNPVGDYELSSTYGMRDDPLGRGQRMHNGLDFAAEEGTPVRSVGDGTVVSAESAGGYGNQVTVRHADGTESSYAHLSEISVSKGRVRAGDVIGEVGSTGNSTGPHLHLEVLVDGEQIDPQTWLRDKGVKV